MKINEDFILCQWCIHNIYGIRLTVLELHCAGGRKVTIIANILARGWHGGLGERPGLLCSALEHKHSLIWKSTASVSRFLTAQSLCATWPPRAARSMLHCALLCAHQANRCTLRMQNTDVNIHGWRMPQLNCHQNPQLRFRKIGAHGSLNCSGERWTVLGNGKG